LANTVLLSIKRWIYKESWEEEYNEHYRSENPSERRPQFYVKNRSDVEIMASMLRSASKKWEYKTTIMNTAALSHSQLVRYLAIAVQKGLVEYSEITGLYKTTEEGLRYLDKYLQLLRLLPAIPELPDIIDEETKEVEKSEDETLEHENDPVRIAS
jgi:predicted transcriptional regulator